MGAIQTGTPAHVRATELFRLRRGEPGHRPGDGGGLLGECDQRGQPSADALRNHLGPDRPDLAPVRRAQISPLLHHAIDERLAWQRPKAIICSILLVAFVTLAVFVWRTLIRQSRAGEPFRKISRRLMLGAGVVSTLSCLVLMLMVIGNTEGAVAPLFITALYG